MGLLGTIGNIGKGIAENSVAGRLVNRYRNHDEDTPLSPNPPMQQDPNAGSMSEAAGMPENDARGKIVTIPIIARVGERGPEAIIPLNNMPGNNVRPDMLMRYLKR